MKDVKGDSFTGSISLRGHWGKNFSLVHLINEYIKEFVHKKIIINYYLSSLTNDYM